MISHLNLQVLIFQHKTFSRESFIVEDGMELAKLYHSLNLRWRRAAKVGIHVALCYSVIPATALTSSPP